MNMNSIFRKILNEGLYQPADFDKHNFLYLNKVLNDFEQQNPIYTRNEDNEVIEYPMGDRGNDFNNNILEFKNWLKDVDESSYNRKSMLTNFENSFGISFTKIEKKDPTIISTAEQESIQAIFLAARIKGGEYKKIFDDILTNTKTSWEYKCDAIKKQLYNKENGLGITLKNNKINFSNKKNMDVLKKLTNIFNIESLKELSHLEKTEFTIIHPDGLNNDVMVDFTKTLFGAGVKWEIENQGYKLSLQKDNFIPADLYIIPLNKIDDIRTIIDTAGKLDPTSIVKLSNKLMGTEKESDVREPLIYPISLKMPSKVPHITKITNSKNENPIRVGMSHIEFIHFNPTGNSTMGIKYEGKKLVLEFRSKGIKDGGDEKPEEHQPWQCNALNKDNTNAIEGGSAKNYMKFVFRDNMNGSINEEDVKKIAKVFKDKIHRPSFTEDLAKSFKRFFEDIDDIEEKDYDEEENELTLDDIENEHTWNSIEKDVLLAVPNMKENGLPKRGESSAKEGNIGLGLFCKKLIENGIEKNSNYNEKFSQIIQMSFKMNEIVQDTWKIT